MPISFFQVSTFFWGGGGGGKGSGQVFYLGVECGVNLTHCHTFLESGWFL